MAGPSSVVSRFRGALGRLTDRERRLVALTTGVASVLLVVSVFAVTQSAVATRKRAVQTRRDEIAQLEALRVKYDESVAAEKRATGRLRANTTSLFSLIQKSAQEVGISLTDLNERRLPVKDSDVQEVTVDVNLKEISVDKLGTLLEKIEGKRADGVVKVTKMKVKTRFEPPDMLEGTLTVSTWKPSGTAVAAPEEAAPQ